MASYEQAKSILSNSVSRRTLYSLKIHNRGKDGRTDPDRDLTREEKRYLKLFCNRITVAWYFSKDNDLHRSGRHGYLQSDTN